MSLSSLLTTVDGHWELQEAALLKAVWWDFRLADGLVVCTVTYFPAAEKARGLKFCMHVGLLSGQVFSPFGELWLSESHGGGGITSGMNIHSN